MIRFLPSLALAALAVTAAPVLAQDVPAIDLTPRATPLPGIEDDQPSDAEALARYRAAAAIAHERLATFDALDFDVFSNQAWDRLHESHSDDVIVHWPDGHVTTGIERHIEDLKALFTYAPDTRIKEHPVAIASGEWTSVIGLMEGTFTEPMVLADGTVIEPTGLAFRLPMATVGHWVDGEMDEEFLFWDSATYMAQMGLGQ